jgi:hypothetical protein
MDHICSQLYMVTISLVLKRLDILTNFIVHMVVNVVLNPFLHNMRKRVILADQFLHLHYHVKILVVRVSLRLCPFMKYLSL